MKKSLPALDLQDAAIIGRARGALPSPAPSRGCQGRHWPWLCPRA